MTEVFSAASHHDILALIIQIAVLLLAARGLGEIAQRLGQPSVVGEILAGILLGPSLLSSMIPAVGSWIVPQTAVQGYLLEVVSLIGVIFLLLITGLETDLALIRRQARIAVGVSLGGITLSFSSGFLLGWFMPATLLANPDSASSSHSSWQQRCRSRRYPSSPRSSWTSTSCAEMLDRRS